MSICDQSLAIFLLKLLFWWGVGGGGGGRREMAVGSKAFVLLEASSGVEALFSPVPFILRLDLIEILLAEPINLSSIKPNMHFFCFYTFIFFFPHLPSIPFFFYTPPHDSGGVLWFHVGRPCVCPSARAHGWAYIGYIVLHYSLYSVDY